MTTITRPLSKRIEDAKLLLDGARQLAERSPTTENEDFVRECTARMDELLDQYPH